MSTNREELIRKRVIKAREASGLTRAEVAAALSLTENSYGHYERGRSPFSVELLFELSRILGCPVGHFLNLDTELNEDEEQLLHLYRQIKGDRLKEMAIELVRKLAE